MMASYKLDEEAVTPSARASVVIAAFVTSIARMKLYSYLRLLKERVLYFDTDSIIFVEGPTDISPPTGDFLGDLTDEITDEYGPDAFIDIFVSGGPKNYAYRVNINGVYKTVCKVKGINLHYRNAGMVNFETLKRLVTEEIDAEVILPEGKRICRSKMHEVFTAPERKTYKVVYKKRRRVENYNTLPFGYKRSRTE